MAQASWGRQSATRWLQLSVVGDSEAIARNLLCVSMRMPPSAVTAEIMPSSRSSVVASSASRVNSAMTPNGKTSMRLRDRRVDRLENPVFRPTSYPPSRRLRSRYCHSRDALHRAFLAWKATSAVNLKFLSLLAASSFRKLQIQNRTKIIKLLVVLKFRSSHLNVTRALANFGIGPLVGTMFSPKIERIACFGSSARTRLDVSCQPGTRLTNDLSSIRMQPAASTRRRASTASASDMSFSRYSS